VQDGKVVYARQSGQDYYLALGYHSAELLTIVGTGFTTETGLLTTPSDIIVTDTTVEVADEGALALQIYELDGLHLEYLPLADWERPEGVGQGAKVEPISVAHVGDVRYVLAHVIVNDTYVVYQVDSSVTPSDEDQPGSGEAAPAVDAAACELPDLSADVEEIRAGLGGVLFVRSATNTQRYVPTEADDGCTFTHDLGFDYVGASVSMDTNADGTLFLLETSAAVSFAPVYDTDGVYAAVCALGAEADEISVFGTGALAFSADDATAISFSVTDGVCALSDPWEPSLAAVTPSQPFGFGPSLIFAGDSREAPPKGV
jgi:hypothetical protein